MFCPPNCGKDDMTCHGPFDYEKGMPMGPDTCMPMKSGDCYNMCPLHCSEKDQMCPGEKDSMGCYTGDYCHPKECKYTVQRFTI